MSAPAYLTTEWRQMALDSERKLLKARLELEAALTWVRHWQADVHGNLMPTRTSLARVEANIAHTLKEVQ